MTRLERIKRVARTREARRAPWSVGWRPADEFIAEGARLDAAELERLRRVDLD